MSSKWNSTTDAPKIYLYLTGAVSVGLGLLPLRAGSGEPIAVIPQVTLREVVEEDLIGLQREPAELMTSVRNSARKYIAWKKNQLSEREVTEWKSACTSTPQADEFCPLVLGLEPKLEDPSDLEIREDDERDIGPIPLSVKEVAQAIKNADFDSLKRASSSSIYRALRPFKEWAPLTALADRVMRESERAQCTNPSIATALAQKAETYLPDPAYREIAKKLFLKVKDCDTTDIVTRARFRLALLNFSEGNCAAAEPLLKKVYIGSDGEYGPRTLYWRARCAKKAGNNLAYKALQQRLLKEYPLSYHSIVINRTEVSRLARVMGVGEPAVLMRSRENPKLNSWVRAVEALHTLGAEDQVRRVIYRVMEPLLKAEPSLRLYMGVLANRAGDPISQFRLLSSVFKDDPSLISQTTLKLFYPLKNFPIIQQYSTEVDSLFVAALIRQESGFNPMARSRVGASGLMQLMPATARSMERQVSKQALFQPQTNIRLGTRYISRLVNRYHRDAELALAAYNAGYDRVDDWVKRYSTDDRMLFLDLIPYKETRDYVVLISRNYFWYNNLYGDALGVKVRSGGELSPDRTLASASEAAISHATSRRLIFTLFE